MRERREEGGRERREVMYVCRYIFRVCVCVRVSANVCLCACVCVCVCVS